MYKQINFIILHFSLLLSKKIQFTVRVMSSVFHFVLFASWTCGNFLTTSLKAYFLFSVVSICVGGFLPPLKQEHVFLPGTNCCPFSVATCAWCFSVPCHWHNGVLTGFLQNEAGGNQMVKGECCNTVLPKFIVSLCGATHLCAA